MSGPVRVPDADLRRRGRLLLAMLTAARFRYPAGTTPPLVVALRRWLGGWAGIGRVAVGMARQGADLQLTRYGDAGWRATFYAAGTAHSVTAATGSGWARAPWTAVQLAAWQALARVETARLPARAPDGTVGDTLGRRGPAATIARGGSGMPKVLRCGDLMAGCKAVVEGKDVDEVMARAVEHAKRDHGLTTVAPDLAAKVRAAIRDK